MPINTLEFRVAEAPAELAVYVGSGDAAREWPSLPAIVASLRRPEADGELFVNDELAAAVARVTPPLTA